MTPSQRIILNTVATYVRSGVTFFLNLFTARWVLMALGQVDLGLFGVVGSIIAFIGFLNMVVSGSVTRFYAYAIGEGQKMSPLDAEKNLNKWFNCALGIHLLLAVGLTVTGYPIGEYAIRHWLTIPPERLTACVWVFRIAMMAVFFSMVSAPYIAMYTAKQLIFILTIFDALKAVVLFIGTYLLLTASGDRLIIYAGLMAFINAGIPIIQSIIARYSFRACRICVLNFFNGARVRKLFSYAGWQLFGGTGAILRSEGSAILINCYFTPQVNAAYSIANQVSGQTQTLAAAMQNALTPAITTAVGSGDRAKAADLALRACRFCTVLALVLVIPVAIEMKEILLVWLKTPPVWTGTLCVFMLIMLIIDKLTFGHMILVAADGHIAWYQTLLGGTFILTLPLAWVLIVCGCDVASIGIAFVTTVSIASFGRVLFCRHMFGLKICEWGRRVLLPIAVLIVLVGGIGCLPTVFLPPSGWRILLTLAVSTVSIGVVGWFLCMDARERGFMIRNGALMIKKARAII